MRINLCYTQAERFNWESVSEFSMYLFPLWKSHKMETPEMPSDHVEAGGPPGPTADSG